MKRIYSLILAICLLSAISFSTNVTYDTYYTYESSFYSSVKVEQEVNCESTTTFFERVVEVVTTYTSKICIQGYGYFIYWIN